jgi:hypothetical protein
MVVIRFSRRQELKALPILVRHSPGTILRGGYYIVRNDAARALRKAGVKFTLVTRVAGT